MNDLFNRELTTGDLVFLSGHRQPCSIYFSKDSGIVLEDAFLTLPFNKDKLSKIAAVFKHSLMGQQILGQRGYTPNKASYPLSLDFYYAYKVRNSIVRLSDDCLSDTEIWPYIVQIKESLQCFTKQNLIEL